MWCIVVAGGSGARWGGAKQFEDLGGIRVIDRAVCSAVAAGAQVVAVVPSSSSGEPVTSVPGATFVVTGGSSRSDSVRAGLSVVPPEASVVLVHDAARPLASVELFRRVTERVLSGADAVIPALAVVDTIRHVEGGVVDRDDLRAVQTPQGFDARALRRAHAREPDATDDASLVEAQGARVVLVEGERRNLKLTDPQDMIVALAWLAADIDDAADSSL